MKTNKLDVYEIENIEDCISEIEKMYSFKFVDNELESIKNFEEFCDLIIEKINLRNVESCTSQQAFYKLRNSLTETKLITKENLNIETELKKIFPRKNRKELIEKVENELKMKLDIIKAPDFITTSLLIIGIASFVLLFIYWKIALVGISISVLGFYLCKWFGNELKVKSVKELVEKITSENYLEVRREKNTINKTELKKILTNWISENSFIKKDKLINATFE
jgi:ABC-type multidrug transport system fused ATPase/permease subunit